MIAVRAFADISIETSHISPATFSSVFSNEIDEATIDCARKYKYELKRLNRLHHLPQSSIPQTKTELKYKNAMASLQYTAPPGAGQKQLKAFHYSQAVRIPGTGLVNLSGQGGWNFETFEIKAGDIDGQVDLAFQNVEKVLQHAGLKGWENVYLMRTYHTDIDSSLGKVVEASKKYCPNHSPIWTAVGVPKLGEPSMLIEVEVEAYDDSAK